MSSIDSAAILGALNPACAARLAQLECFPEIESTNAYLMARPAPAVGMHRVAIAGHQTAGRGRGEKRWLSAPGSSLCLSIAHTFRERPGNLSALTLAVGVAAVRALRDTGIDDVMLKWPNDIVACEGKLGGMLAESHRTSAANASVVVGIGINLDLPPAILESVDSEWAHAPVDLKNVLGRTVVLEPLTAVVIEHIVDALLTFEKHGLHAFVKTWNECDWLRGRDITVQQHGGSISGTAFGIDRDGALLVQAATSTARIISGSILVNGAGSPST
jgi:BirA family biotin operon repressor/biotin-[acetyl-CoA-carboxylase] ligase